MKQHLCPETSTLVEAATLPYLLSTVLLGRKQKRETQHKAGTRYSKAKNVLKNHLLTADMHSQALCFRFQRGQIPDGRNGKLQG